MSASSLEGAAQSPPLRFLVVEDERVVARDLKACLEGLGYVVLALVTTGEAAIEKARALRPDLIMMDIRLEGALDGITSAQQIWAECQIPSIYTTGYSDQATVDRATEGTLFGYILKPVRERDLYIAIKTALQRQQERQTLNQDVPSEALSVLRSIGDGVIVTDALGRVKFLNEVATALTGWTMAAAHGQHCTAVFQLLNLQTQEPIADLVAQVLETGRTVYLVDPVLLVTANRQRIPVADSAAPLQDAEGNLTGVVVVFRDVADRELVKALSTSQQRLVLLEQQLEEVQESQTQKDEFLSEASHELRTPLASIKLAVHMLELNLDRRLVRADAAKNPTDGATLEAGLDTELNLENDVQSANLSRYFDILRTECDRELQLVNELLEMQRLESGRVLVEWKPLQLLPWLYKQLEPYQVRASVRNQTLSLLIAGSPCPDPDAEPLVLISDAELLARIVNELSTNSCKYTPPDGDIIVNVIPSDAMHIPLRLSISNTGTAIPPEALSHLFDRFYRVPGRDKWKQGGTGLGLALVKRQVQYLDGKITVTSDDQLTVFTVSLPIMPIVEA